MSRGGGGGGGSAPLTMTVSGLGFARPETDVRCAHLVWMFAALTWF